MTVSVSRGGVTRTAKRRATVIPCPTGDTTILGSMLDIEIVREALAFLWESNHGNIPMNRREASGWIYQDTITGEYSFKYDVVQSHATPCSDSVAIAPAPPNSKLVVIVHPHPLDPGIDIVPPHTSCNADSLSGKPQPGLSIPDMTASAVTGVPTFALDFQQIYGYDWRTETKKNFPKGGACPIIRPVTMNRRPVRPPPIITPQPAPNTGKRSTR